MSSNKWLQQAARRLLGETGVNLLDFAVDAIERQPPRSVSYLAPRRDEAGEARWHGVNEPVDVAGVTIPGGLLYIGTSLPTRAGTDDAALINPTLPVGPKRTIQPDRDLGYWPMYARLSPIERAGYLAWLADGRRSTQVPVGYAQLFFFGLERRVLLDIAADRALNHELPEVRAAVVTLIAQFGKRHPGLRYCGTALLDVIELLAVSPLTLLSLPAPAPPRSEQSFWSVPSLLPLVLSAHAATKRPVPAAWALLWAWHHPEVSLRTPALRCPNEFNRLFLERYRATHGEGMRMRPTVRPIQLYYSAANPSLGAMYVKNKELPDVFAGKAAGRRLGTLVAEVCAELDGYSRWLGRNPTKARTLAALAMLPPSLVDPAAPGLRGLTAGAEAALGEGFVATVDGAALLRHWDGDDAAPDRLPKAATVALLRLLGRLGYGVEPDLRFGGAALAAAKPVVLFRLLANDEPDASPAYGKAVALLQLAAMVSQADGRLTHHEIAHLTRHLATADAFSPSARRRLHAHLMWLAASGAPAAGLAARLATLSQPERAAMGELVVRVAAADGAVSPPEVAALMKAFRLLGLDPATVTSRLHHSLTAARPSPSPAPSPATRPITVRAAAAPSPGYPIPPRPLPAPSPDAAPAVVLDQAAIQAKLAETAAVADLLAGIFADEADSPPRNEAAGHDDAGRPLAPAAAGASATGTTGTPLDAVAAAPGTSVKPRPRAGKAASRAAASDDTGMAGPSPAAWREQPAAPVAEAATPSDPTSEIAGLDAAHEALLRQLATEQRWSWAAFAARAAEHGLLPAAALDVLNEAAYAAADEPVLEGDDPLTLNPAALETMLG